MPSRAGVPNIRDLMPDDLRRSWGNNDRSNIHDKCNVLESSAHYSPTLIRGKIVLHETGHWCKKFGDLCSRGLEDITKSQSSSVCTWVLIMPTYRNPGFLLCPPSLGFFSQHPTANCTQSEDLGCLLRSENESFKMILFNFLVVLWWESILALATPWL